MPRSMWPMRLAVQHRAASVFLTAARNIVPRLAIAVHGVFDADARPRLRTVLVLASALAAPLNRAVFPVVLKIFRHRNAMTTAQVGTCSAGRSRRRSASARASWSTWGLLEPCATEKGQVVYRVTPLALDFLDGRAPVPEYVWPRDVQLPEGCVDGPLRYLKDMQAVHPAQDKARHMEDAVAWVRS